MLLITNPNSLKQAFVQCVNPIGFNLLLKAHASSEVCQRCIEQVIDSTISKGQIY